MNDEPMQEGRAFGKDVQPENPTETLADVQEEQASEEEQAIYELVVARAVKFFHSKGKDQTLKMLSAGESPADAIGRTASMIVRAIKKSADESKKPIDDTILFHAGIEIVQELFEYGTEAGIFNFADDEEAQQQLDEALFFALKYYGEEALASNETDQAEMQKLMEQGAKQEQAAASAKVGGAVRQAMGDPQTPPQGAGIARDKAGMINAAMGGA